MSKSLENPGFIGDDGLGIKKTIQENPGFIGDDGLGIKKIPQDVESISQSSSEETPGETKTTEVAKERDQWGGGLEFLMSCIAMSVGLGNVWRFPFAALENGGGAFLIPYLIVLFLVGKPIYYLEMIIGQFSSRGSVKVYDLCPAMRGVAIGQVYSITTVCTYYIALMALTLRFLYDSFSSPLPWAECQSDWKTNGSCIPSGDSELARQLYARTDKHLMKTSAELYFFNNVLRERANIDDGIGTPNWELVIGLFVSWLAVVLIISRGVRSSGKAAYFLAIFPYVIMAILLVRAVTLEGSAAGIIYFIKPDWNKIGDPQVWYAAVTQCFYSLSVCFGNIVMYASYNRFSHNIYRDATIVTALDTCTSLIAGFTIFGIIGHLAHEIGTDDIGSVVKGDTGLAFISYPDAIAKFKKVPQIFAVLFFVMLFVLGIGSNIAMTSCTVTAIRDRFPKVKQWHCGLAIAVVSFGVGLMYVTPGGQFMLKLVDFFGASMIALWLGIAELYVLGWVYGTDRLCKDVEFMLKRKVGLYWRLCWSFVTPFIMTVILIYFLATYEVLTYNDIVYPNWAYAFGWTLSVVGILQIPIWMIVAIVREPGDTFGEKVRSSFRPKGDWGPREPLLREQYNKELENESIIWSQLGFWGKIKRNMLG